MSSISVLIIFATILHWCTAKVLQTTSASSHTFPDDRKSDSNTPISFKTIGIMVGVLMTAILAAVALACMISSRCIALRKFWPRSGVRGRRPPTGSRNSSSSPINRCSLPTSSLETLPRYPLDGSPLYPPPPSYDVPRLPERTYGPDRNRSLPPSYELEQLESFGRNRSQV